MESSSITTYSDAMHLPWEQLMEMAVTKMLQDTTLVGYLPLPHIEKTPERMVRLYKEYMSGVNVNTEAILSTHFPVEGVGSMVVVKDIPFVSLCMHHLVRFHGKAHFGYVPNYRLIGLSKIARLVDAFARRPQLQERLGEQIIDAFDSAVKPLGCGIIIEATHDCMALRGIEAQGTITKTSSLRGGFLKNELAKLEFLEAIK